MKRVFALILIFLGTAGLALFFIFVQAFPSLVEPVSKIQVTPTPLPLAKYSFNSLRGRIPQVSNITIGEEIEKGNGFASSIFYFKTSGKKVSGLANFPRAQGVYPVIIMLRGFVDSEIYETGMGTERSGQELARNGFITLAPDFLGYGTSASPSAFPIEERFETYTTVLDLLASLSSLNEAFSKSGLSGFEADEKSVGLWGHSNGGQIALSILAITGKKYPTVLWAPVSKPFPYSILYYTDEFEDKGKELRRVLAEFEAHYDVEEFNPINYLGWIEASISLHQDRQDLSVPKEWSDELYSLLSEKDISVDYFIYPGENHNFTSGSFPAAISRSIDFYRDNF